MNETTKRYEGWTITVHVLGGNLFNEDPMDHGIDRAKSIDRYVELYEAAIEAGYPGAVVRIEVEPDTEGAMPHPVTVTGVVDEDDAWRVERDAIEDIDGIGGKVFEAGEWYVELVYGLTELAAAVGWTDKKLSTYRGRGLLPKPTFEVGARAFWTHHDAQAFIAERTSKWADWAIRVAVGHSSLWTDDPRNHGLDEAASAKRYVGLVRDALRAEYPGATIAVTYDPHVDARTIVTVEAAHLTEDEECVRSDIERDVVEAAEGIAVAIQDAGPWYVKGKPAPSEDHPYEVRRPWLPATHPERWQQAHTISRHQSYDAAIRVFRSGRQKDAVCGRDKDGTWRPMPAAGPSRPEPAREDDSE